jgi:hypothetical protein
VIRLNVFQGFVSLSLSLSRLACRLFKFDFDVFRNKLDALNFVHILSAIFKTPKEGQAIRQVFPALKCKLKNG